MFLFLLGFFFGWAACSWYVENGRSFDRAVGPLAQGAQEALGEASRAAGEAGRDASDGKRGRGTTSAARRSRRAGTA
jgi:hypothetical protein